MDGDIELTVLGLADLEKALLELGAEMGFKTLRTAGRKAMVPVHIAAAIGAHRASGELQESIAISTAKGKYGDEVVTINVGATKKSIKGRKLNNINQKAAAQEYGTSKQPADPFLRPALTQNADRVLVTFKTELSNAVARAVRKAAKGNA